MRISSSNSKPRSIQSIGVGFRLIRCLEEAAGPVTLKELAEKAGMSASQAHVYLASFAQLGLVAQDRVSRYELGPYALQLGLAALRRLDVVALAKEPMYQLKQRTGEAVYLSVWGNRGPSIVQKVDGLGPIPMQLRVGYVLPLLTSASGRVFLAYLPRAETADLVKAELASWPTARQEKPTAAKLEALIRDIRRQGVAQTASLLNVGFTALAAPILDHAGELCATLTLIGPSSLLDTDPHGENADALRAAAADISRQLGFRTSPSETVCANMTA